jgi:hypothetical protein
LKTYLLLLSLLPSAFLAASPAPAAPTPAKRPLITQVATIHTALPADLRGKTFEFQHRTKKASSPDTEIYMNEVQAELGALGVVPPEYKRFLPDYYVIVDISVQPLDPATVAVTAPAYRQKLIVVIVDQAASTSGHPAMVYEGGVIAEGFSADLHRTVPEMIKLLFKNFPGKDGEVRNVPPLAD